MQWNYIRTKPPQPSPVQPRFRPNGWPHMRVISLRAVRRHNVLPARSQLPDHALLGGRTAIVKLPVNALVAYLTATQLPVDALLGSLSGNRLAATTLGHVQGNRSCLTT